VACEIIAAVKKRIHISGVKRLFADFPKVGGILARLKSIPSRLEME
jgi:hypothetical protein